MQIKIIVLIGCLFIILFAVSGTVYGGNGADESTDGPISMFSKLIKFDPISCPDNTECLCVEVEAKKHIPLRYKYSKWCSLDTDNSSPTVGTWSVTNFDQEWHKTDEGQYVNGKMHGKWIGWNPNGAIRSEGFYEEGNPIGVLTTWHENGTKAVTGNYLEGEPDGVWIYRDKDGNITKRLVWEDGELVSNETFE